MSENENVEVQNENAEAQNESVEVQQNEQGEATGGRKKVTMEKFINTWVEVAKSDNPSVQEVADRLGLEKNSVGQRASDYRTKRNIPLPKMPKGGGARFKTDKANDILNAALAKFDQPEKKAEGETEGQGEQAQQEAEAQG